MVLGLLLRLHGLFIKARCQLNGVDRLGLLVHCDNVQPLGCWTDVLGRCRRLESKLATTMG